MTLAFKTTVIACKLLNAVFNPNQEQCDYLYNVSKNVQVRNAFQHRERKVDEFFCENWGSKNILVRR